MENTQPVLQYTENQSSIGVIYDPSLHNTFENLKNSKNFYESFENLKSDKIWERKILKNLVVCILRTMEAKIIYLQSFSRF